MSTNEDRMLEHLSAIDLTMRGVERELGNTDVFAKKLNDAIQSSLSEIDQTLYDRLDDTKHDIVCAINKAADTIAAAITSTLNPPPRCSLIHQEPGTDPTPIARCSVCDTKYVLPGGTFVPPYCKGQQHCEKKHGEA